MVSQGNSALMEDWVWFSIVTLPAVVSEAQIGTSDSRGFEYTKPRTVGLVKQSTLDSGVRKFETLSSYNIKKKIMIMK